VHLAPAEGSSDPPVRLIDNRILRPRTRSTR
jgi:hypothetical protein